MEALMKLFKQLNGEHLPKVQVSGGEEIDDQVVVEGIDCCDVVDTCCDNYCDNVA